MSPNPEMGRTQKDIKNPEGRTMVERVQARLEAEKNDIRDFFHTNKGESEVLMTSDLEALGYNEENFELSKQVYGEMAMEELDKFASGDELARSLLKKRVERIQDMMDYGSAWHAMQLLSPKWMAKVAIKEAENLRKKQAEQDAGERVSALEGVRSKIRIKRPTMTVDQAQEFQDWQKVQQASMEGGGFAGTAVAEAPEELKEEIGKAEGKVRRGKGFKTATGEFESKAEAFASGLSLEKLGAQEEVMKIMAGLTRSEIAQFQPHAERYIANIDSRKKEWTKAIDQAKKFGDMEKANKLQASSEREAELNRTLLEELAKAIKINPRILEQ